MFFFFLTSEKGNVFDTNGDVFAFFFGFLVC